jgi:hypothetical protein
MKRNTVATTVTPTICETPVAGAVNLLNPVAQADKSEQQSQARHAEGNQERDPEAQLHGMTPLTRFGLMQFQIVSSIALRMCKVAR